MATSYWSLFNFSAIKVTPVHHPKEAYSISPKEGTAAAPLCVSSLHLGEVLRLPESCFGTCHLFRRIHVVCNMTVNMQTSKAESWAFTSMHEN